MTELYFYWFMCLCETLSRSDKTLSSCYLHVKSYNQILVTSIIYKISMLSASLVTTVWHALKLQLQDTLPDMEDSLNI